MKSSALNLSVEIDDASGFCFGVVKAVKKAEEHLEHREILYCLGEIVHNDEEIHRLEKKGLKIITREELIRMKDSKVIFRAHGEPPVSYELARKSNNEVIDASCPIILRLQKDIKKSYDRGESIAIFGERNHPEVAGLNGQINNQAIIIEKPDDTDTLALPDTLTLYSQTTKDREVFKTIVTRLREKGIQLNVHDTTCKQVSNRKEKIRDFCGKYDKIVFIAGKNSSNGKVLFNYCSEANKNTFFISTADMIRKEWFTANEKVGICGATSTPHWVMQEAKLILESF